MDSAYAYLGKSDAVRFGCQENTDINVQGQIKLHWFWKKIQETNSI